MLFHSIGIVMKFSSDMHVTLRMNRNYSDDPLTLHHHQVKCLLLPALWFMTEYPQN